MHGIAKLRIGRGDDEVASREQRASARKRSALHARDHGDVEFAQGCNARAEPLKEISGARRLLRAEREVESRAEARAISSEHEHVCMRVRGDVRDVLAEARERLHIQRVSTRCIAQRDAGNPRLDP